MPRRRALLRWSGLALTGVVAGCRTARPSPETPTGNAPVRTTGDGNPEQWRVTHDARVAHLPAVGDDRGYLSWISPGESGPGAVTGLGPDGAVRWHRELDRPPNPRTGPGTIHQGDYYVVTALDNGMVPLDQRLRQFAPDGTERWQTDVYDGGFLKFLGFAGDRVLLGEWRESAGDQATLRSLALADGTPDWSQPAGPSTRGWVSDGGLVADVGPAGVGRYGLATGSERWQRRVDPLLDAAGRPTLDSRSLFAQAGTDVLAVDADTGETRWRVRPAAGGTPVGAVTGGDSVLTTVSSGAVVQIDPADGTVRETVALDGDGESGADGDSPSRPLVASGTVYAADGTGTIFALDVADMTIRWQTSIEGTLVQLGRTDEALIAAGGPDRRTIASVALADGSVQWRYEAPAELGGFRTDGRTVYAAVADGTVVALE